MKIAIIGIGLIGGSMAITWRARQLATTIIGVDNNEQHAQEALNTGLVDCVLPLPDAIGAADVILVATPVNAAVQLLPLILDQLLPHQTVMDVGSTKADIIKSIQNHANRSQFVATHPMAGTEFSGPQAAIPNLFDGKCNVIVDAQDSSPRALATAQQLYEALNMRIVYLNAQEHDLHTAYVSHISHLSSFALALTVLEKEQDEKRIFDLASGGFRSTVRLAKSSPDMWTPIFEQNRTHLLDVLEKHLDILQEFKQHITQQNFEACYQMMAKANDIKRILL